MIEIPLTPWTLSGLVYDIDGSTALADATVVVTNIRSGEKKTVTSESDGSYSVIYTSYEDDDILIAEARLEISSLYDKVGIAATTIDTGVAGKNLNITVDKYINKSIETVIHRTPIQEREDRIFDPRFDAIRVIPSGFDPKDIDFTRDANHYVTSIEEKDGIHILLTTITRDASHYVTNIAERIK